MVQPNFAELSHGQFESKASLNSEYPQWPTLWPCLHWQIAKRVMVFLAEIGYNPTLTTKRAGIYRPFFLAVCFCIFG